MSESASDLHILPWLMDLLKSSLARSDVIHRRITKCSPLRSRFLLQGSLLIKKAGSLRRERVGIRQTAARQRRNSGIQCERAATPCILSKPVFTAAPF